ncbi:hypothetical protein [Bounagaea algeriensis]
MRETDLPPKPNPQTGQPRPPHAPLEQDWSGPDEKHKNGESKVPRPPEDGGPILEWFYPRKKDWAIIGSILSGIIIVFLTFKDWGVGWMSVWWLWLFVIPWPFIFMLAGKNLRLSAGADWVCGSQRTFVKTYELVQVKATVGGAARSIELKDRHGNEFSAQLNDIQRNRELWDLVYNGILHSVHVHGAETNKMARDFLGLNMPPQYRPQR